MRILAQPRTALERQVWESVNIDRLSLNPEACLNLKSEWGLLQTLFLQPKPNKPGKRAEEDKAQGKRSARDIRKEESQEMKPPGKRLRREAKEGKETEQQETEQISVAEEEFPEGEGARKQVFEDCKPNTPIREKIRRFQARESSSVSTK